MDYHVEELAEIAGVAVDTIRYYQREKLLPPPRREGRRAFYDDAHLDRIRQIKDLAQQGFSLAQIRSLSTPDGSGLLADLADQNASDPDLDKTELARRAEVPEFIIDVVVSAGLLTPTGEGDDQRFAADAVDMLVAARTLVSEGVSLEELTALAMRHATHIEDVVDDAIELFKRNSDAKGRDREELVGLMHRLVPVASSLVGQHFERTLRTRALARLGEDAPPAGGGVVVFARRLDERVDPVAIYGAATDHHRSLWVRPDDGFALVALGAAELIEPHGDTRFSAASAARAALSARIRRHGPADAPAPVLVGGFSFTTGNRPIAPDWTGFPDARWILPEVTVVDRPDGSWLLAATSLDEGEDEGAALDMLEARLEEMAATPAPAPAAMGEIVRGDATHDDPDYVDLVADAIGDIRAGDLDKVVLARIFRRGPIDTPAVLRALADRFPACATFAFGVGNRAFIGASPERLVTLDGREVSTVALAGTTGTGWDETSDAALAAEMLASAKVRSEHQFVVDDITARLATLGLVGETPAEPEVMRLARVQHLRTPITARVERRTGTVSDMDVLRVANVLHPSPAVGGTPSDPAVEWILANEGFDRGWYAAPVGWTDLDGNGELRVALRSALVDESQVQLFSGAGIVAAHGVRDVVISPGSRSTPLAVTFHAHPELQTHIQLDERAAGFFALGQAKASGRPSVLICTSGTAAANYLPAVVEANHARVPMIVCTADRPPELRGWGAGQTIDQVGMFTSNVRWFADLPIPSDWSEAAARMAATRAHEAATGDGRGPVHLNWPLRKPLEPVAAVPVRTYDPVDDGPGLWSSPGEPFAAIAGVEKGVILVGPDAAPGVKAGFRLAEAIADFGAAVGWPIIAEPMTQLRFRRSDAVIATGEHVLKHGAVVDDLRPDVVVRFGAAPTTAPVNQWLERVRPAQVIAVDPEQRWHDASFTTTSHVTIDPLVYAMNGAARVGVTPGAWLDRWRALDDTAAEVIDRELAAGGRTSGSVVRDLCSIAAGEPLFVMSSNSMPPRDLDSFVPGGTPIGFVGNRGAAGIDSITSTALGFATHVGAEAPVVVFTGDLALLHDIGGLLGVQRAGVHLTVVCIDNDGGQIFSMLPINGRIDTADYDTIFRTPHGVDLAGLDGLAGVRATVVDEGDDLAGALRTATAVTHPGVDLLVVRIDPDHDMAVRRRIRETVGEAIGA